jgi:hypothetical protein
MDVVKAHVNSFRSHGLKVALYYSILDLRNDIRHFNVTRDEIELIKTQLTELLTNYGGITLGGKHVRIFPRGSDVHRLIPLPGPAGESLQFGSTT